MATDLSLTVVNPLNEQLYKALVLDSVDSAHTKLAYDRALTEFIDWHRQNGLTALNKAVVQHYATSLREKGLSAASVNIKLSAIRKLAREMAENNLLSQEAARSVEGAKNIRQEGQRLGNWLSKDKAQALLDAVDIRTLKGCRDRAILAVLLGCGLRRSEVVSLTFNHVRQLDGRWVIVDIVGKRNKVRSVPMPSWAKAAIDEWAKTAGLSSGHVFRAVKKGGKLAGEQMTDQAIADVVRQYAAALGIANLAAHDLRRTFAKLAHKGGAGIDQVQLSLGHASVKTTELYLGVEQDLTNAPCDHLGLRLG